jgi:hypothetical protein
MHRFSGWRGGEIKKEGLAALLNAPLVGGVEEQRDKWLMIPGVSPSQVKDKGGNR